MSEIECPYCSHQNEHDGESYQEDGNYEWQCADCELNFIMNPRHSVSFHTEKADCLNGSEHTYRRQVGYPEERMETLCTQCGRQLPGERLPHKMKIDEGEKA